jgi:hypothetical protein
VKAILVSAILALASSALLAQGEDTRSGTTVVAVTLGQSVVALTGPWKFHVGDDPGWADPGFDDSQWEQFELAPGMQNLTPERVLRLEELPGWQDHGHSSLRPIWVVSDSVEYRVRSASDLVAHAATYRRCI